MKPISIEQWNKEWTAWSFFTLNNKTYMYSYKEKSGTYDLCVIDGVKTSNVPWTRLDRGEIEKGFTAAETFIEKGVPYVMMYNEQTGKAYWYQLKIN